MNGARAWTETRTAAWALVAVVVVVFARSLAGEFVFDDHRFIVENPVVRSPTSWSAFLTDAGTADPFFPQGIVRPLRTLEFALDHAVFGLSPAAFHLHSLLWHVASALLLLHVLRRLLGDATAAFAASLIWAVHPAQVESVALISSRGDVAMGACSFASILFALRTKDAWSLDVVLSLAAAALACLYKETAVALPIVIAVLRWTKRSRAALWPYFVVVGVYLLYRGKIQPHGTMGVSFVLGGSLAGTFATMFRAFGFYLAEALLPAQSFDWYMTPSTSLGDAAALGWLAVHAALVASAVALRRRAPLYAVGVACFYAFLLPVANWPFFTGIPTTERFLYLPLAGLAVLVGAALIRSPRAMAAGRTGPSGGGSRAATAAFVVAGAFGVASFARAGMWRDDDALRVAVLADHESPRCRHVAAIVQEHQGISLRIEAAALPVGPARDEMEARATRLLETALDDEHRMIDEWLAFEMVERSTSVEVMRGEYTAANLCRLLGRDAEALFHAEESIRIKSDDRPEPHFSRAWSLLHLGFAREAAESMSRARRLGFGAPNAEIHRFFKEAAEALAKDDMPSAAQAAWGQALECAPSKEAFDDAKRRYDELASRTVTATEADLERIRSNASEERLVAFPRSCPARRDHSIRK